MNIIMSTVGDPLKEQWALAVAPPHPTCKSGTACMVVAALSPLIRILWLFGRSTIFPGINSCNYNYKLHVDSYLLIAVNAVFPIIIILALQSSDQFVLLDIILCDLFLFFFFFLII